MSDGVQTEGLPVEAPPEEQREAPPEEQREAPPEQQREAAEPEARKETEQHAPGALRIPEGVSVVQGSPNGSRRTVAITVSRFNGDISTKLLDGALAALDEAGVERDSVDVMPVPGAFELPLGALALAKTRRYACVIALGCVIRGDTPHFEYVAAEAASGLQVAALETGIPVSFGVLTCDNRRQAEIRAGGARGNKGAEAARAALEMADLVARLRTTA